MCIICCYPLANMESHFRQQQKLLKVLQAIESDSAHLSRAASPTEEQALDPQVRPWTSRHFHGVSGLSELAPHHRAQCQLCPLPVTPQELEWSPRSPSYPQPPQSGKKSRSAPLPHTGLRLGHVLITCHSLLWPRGWDTDSLDQSGSSLGWARVHPLSVIA